MKPEAAKRENFKWFNPIEVRWGDMDALGHVNNAQYFVYSESARIAFFDEVFAGDDKFMNGQGPILANISCDYLQQVHYPAELDVGVGIEKIGRSSLVLQCPVFKRGSAEAVATIRAVIVWFDYDAQQAIAVPDKLQDFLMV